MEGMKRPDTTCGQPLTSEEAELHDDAELVSRILCRLQRLARSGCVRPDCLVLAGRLDVDLGRSVALIARGCPPDLALRILV